MARLGGMRERGGEKEMSWKERRWLPKGEGMACERKIIWQDKM